MSSYLCPIGNFGTESLASTFFEIFASKYIWVTTLTCLDHVTSSVTWPFDSPSVTSYRCSIVTVSLSPTIFEIMGIFYIWVTTLTFLSHVTSYVTWPSVSPGAISYRCSIVTESLSPTIFEIMGIFISRSRRWPVQITWRHRSRDQSIRHMSFPIGVPLKPNFYL